MNVIAHFTDSEAVEVYKKMGSKNWDDYRKELENVMKTAVLGHAPIRKQ